MSRVKRGGSFFNFKDVYVRREEVVDFHPDDFRSEDGLNVKMSDLSACMYSGVRATRSLEFELSCLKHLPQGLNQVTLHRTGVLLNLPAGVTGTIVFQQEAKA